MFTYQGGRARCKQTFDHLVFNLIPTATGSKFNIFLAIFFGSDICKLFPGYLNAHQNNLCILIHCAALYIKKQSDAKVNSVTIFSREEKERDILD